MRTLRLEEQNKALLTLLVNAAIPLEALYINLKTDPRFSNEMKTEIEKSVLDIRAFVANHVQTLSTNDESNFSEVDTSISIPVRVQMIRNYIQHNLSAATQHRIQVAETNFLTLNPTPTAQETYEFIQGALVDGILNEESLNVIYKHIKKNAL